MNDTRHMLSKNHYGGWRRSPEDPKDFKANTAGLDVLDSADLRQYMPPAYNQRRLGSCTAQTVAAHMQMDMHLDGQPLRNHRPSRLFVYYLERMLEGNLDEGDTGAVGRTGYYALQHYGWIPEHDWRYIIVKYQTRPPKELWDAAAENLLEKPYKLVPRSRDAFKQVFSNNQAIGFGFTVYESFEYPEVERTGIVPMPMGKEGALGGHEVLACGYNPTENIEPWADVNMDDYFLCRNSWGTGWGNNGYFLMPWAYIEDQTMSGDFRTIVRAT